MKTGMSSLQQFAAEIERRAKAKEDLVASTRVCKLVTESKATHVDPDDPGSRVLLQVGDTNIREYEINRTGHAQLAETTGIPQKYYDRMLSADQNLLCSNVNEWFRREPANRLWRTLDGKLRAVRSDSFRTDLEYEDLAGAVLPVLMDLDVAIMSYQLTESKMYIKAVDKRVERELQAVGGKFGDGGHKIVRCLSPGIAISDSEVGYGSARVDAGVYDRFCSNVSWFGERSVRKYHVGARHELAAGTDYSLLSDETKRKTGAAMIAQIKDVVRAAFDRAKFDSLCDKIADTRQDKIEGDVGVAVKVVGVKLGLTAVEVSGVFHALAEGGDLSRFGLYNAVTRMSQDVECYDRATELEGLGARVIELPKKEWREVALAA